MSKVCKCGCELPDEAVYCFRCGRKYNPTRTAKRRGNGQGTAYKRGNTWTAQATQYTWITKDGIRHQKLLRKGGFKTKKEAIAYLETLRAGEVRKVPTLLSLYTAWEENELPKLSKDKKSAYKKARQRLDSLMGRKIDNLTTEDLQSVVNGNSTSFYTARDMKSLLSKLYKRAIADRFVQSNLASFIVLPELDEKDPVPFTADEVQKMWGAFADGDTFVGFLLLMIYSGMMPGELLACRKDMIDFDRCEIYGCGKKTKTRKKGVIVFADIVKPVLQELCSFYNGEKLYPHVESEWYHEYHDATQRIGVRDLPPYSCRHTTGTEAAKQNLNAPAIQKIMRHGKITTTQRYIHLGTDEAHAGINQISITHT